MKKHRKQLVKVFGEKLLIDVPVDPVDDELYRADNREEYQREKSKAKHVSLDEIILADSTADVIEAYEEAQLLECLSKALQALSEEERRLIEYIYYDVLTERKAASIIGISQQGVAKRKRKIIQKLRNSLIDWL